MRNLNRLFICLLLIVAQRASCQLAHPATTEEFGLRGDNIGESLADFRARNHRPSDNEQIVGDPEAPSLPRCSGDVIPYKMPEQPSPTDKDFVRKQTAYYQAQESRRAHYSTNDEFLDAIAHQDGEDKACTLNDGTFARVAGVGAFLVFKFKADRLDAIESQFRRDSYAIVKAAIIAKYGQPSTVSHGEYRNKTGAVFTGDVCRWMRPASIISLSEFSPDLDESELYILSPQTRIDYAATQQKKADADF